MWEKLMNLYNTNSTFHSFVTGLEGAIVSAATSYTGGVPTNKTGWYALASFFGVAVYNYIKRYLQTNVATRSVLAKTS
jgi:hypothetical protein